MTFPAQPLRFDVSDVIGEQASLAATYYPARTGADAGAVLVCLPGGTYSREYWDLHVAGHRGYSFAEFATGERLFRPDDRPARHRRQLQTRVRFRFHRHRRHTRERCVRIARLNRRPRAARSRSAFAGWIPGDHSTVAVFRLRRAGGPRVYQSTRRAAEPGPRIHQPLGNPGRPGRACPGDPFGSSPALFRGPPGVLAELVSPCRRAGRRRGGRLCHRKVGAYPACSVRP